MSIIILRNHFHAFRLAIYGNSILHFLIYLSISVSDFDLTFHPLAVIHRLLFCKGIAGREHGKHRNKSYWRKTFHDPPKSQIAVS